MKKLYILFFFAFSFIVNAQIVNIPDANFKAKLLSASSSNTIASVQSPDDPSPIVYNSIDINGDGEIQLTEASLIKYLHIESSIISNLTGIESFINLEYLITATGTSNLNFSSNLELKYLRCGAYWLNGINISQNYNLKYLSVIGSNITTLDLSSNVNLTQLFCYQTKLTNLDISQNNSLIYVDCRQSLISSIIFNPSGSLETLICNNNRLINLNLNEQQSLTFLNCSYNLLTALNTSHNLNLTFLDCSDNQINNLDLGLNINLNTLECSYNSLTSIDVSNCSELADLVCNNNNLLELHLENNINLETLNVINNQLTILDVNSNFLLRDVNCAWNNLEYLFVKNNKLGYAASNSLIFSFNPNLKYVCVEEHLISSIQARVDAYGYTNCNVNDYCSFTPGGTFYEIKGNTKLDSNNNGCDITGFDYKNLAFSISDGNNLSSMIANQTGNYYIPVVAGNHTVMPVLESPTYFTISPTSFVVNFPTQASPFTQDFCVTANGVKSDVEVMVMSTVPARPGFDAIYKIVYRNKGNQIENGSVALTFDDAVLDYVSSNPVYNTSATNNFSWNYSNLQPFETREIAIVLNVNGPTETPAVNNGDILNYTASITTSNTDEMPNDNTFTLNQTVVGSYDPNDKTCLEGETVGPSMVGEYVHYIIRFENTGTFPAENIVVKDMIDLAKFDIATLVPLKGSHDYHVRIDYSNKVEFIFENINLDFNDATNDGYVAFKIKTKSTLVIGDTFSNDANIYFDYNFPITTNTYTTTIAALSTQNFEFGSEFTLYPNPAKEVLNIQSKNSLAIQSIEIYNILGQVVLAVPNNTNAIDVSNLKTGTYFVKVNTEKGSSNTKFVKE